MTKKAAAAIPLEPTDPLDRLAKAGARDIIALMLWQGRFNNPSMAMQITPRDIEGLEKCLKHQKLEAEVVIMRPSGRPAQEALQGGPGQRSVAARPADPPRKFVVVALVEKGSKTDMGPGNAITPMEDNQADYDRAAAAKQLQETKAGAHDLAARLLSEDAAGIATRSTIEAAAHALRVLGAE